tara:strand:- start:1506 stop:2102 length:597 start_codon:yes stop_codon:yes gene_type:complete
MKKKIYLASSSIYRKQLLRRLNINFETFNPNIDESPLKNELPRETALRLAKSKAISVSKHVEPALIIGSDQTASLNGEIISKPGNHANALIQLKKMQGKTIIFNTSVCLYDNLSYKTSKLQIKNVISKVKFREFSEKELNAYLQIDRPYNCSGSSKNESLGIVLIESIKTQDPSALTGLPLISLSAMLRSSGVSFFEI